MEEINQKLANASLRAKDTRKGMNKPTSFQSHKHNNEDNNSSLSAKLKQQREKLNRDHPVIPNSPRPSATIEDLVHHNQQKMAFTSLCTELIQLAHKFKETKNLASLQEINSIVALSCCPTLILFPHPTIPLTLAQAQTITFELANFRNKLSSSIQASTILLLKKGLLLSGKKLSYSLLEWLLTWPFHKLSEELTDEELGVRVGHMLENREYALELAYGGDEEVREKMVEYVFGGYARGGECCNGFRGLGKGEYLDGLRGVFEETRRELGGICGCDECRSMVGGEGASPSKRRVGSMK